MSNSPAPTDQNAILMMRFSKIAYDDPDDIQPAVTNPNIIPPASGQWNCVWGPCDDMIDVIEALAFVVQNQQTNEYAVVIRGTTPDSLTDWNFDLETWPAAPVSPLIPVNGATTTPGTMDMLNLILGLTGGGQNLLAFFQNLNPAPQTVFVTGHSLGGALTPLVAAYLHNQLPNLAIQPYSFAGFTPGNQVLAGYLDSLFGNGPAWRYYNDLDVVPIVWTTLAAVQNLYTYPFQGLGPAAIAGAFGQISAPGQYYFQPQTGGYSLSGTLLTNFNPNDGTDWDQEAEYQHSYAGSYLPLMLGQPQVLIQASAKAAGQAANGGVADPNQPK